MPPVCHCPGTAGTCVVFKFAWPKRSCTPPDVHTVSNEVDGKRVAERVVAILADKRAVAAYDAADVMGEES
ncbi:MAG: hypothetical protein ACXVIP_06035 [Halobacteriota archaeon]